jgi:hypothetical protein
VGLTGCATADYEAYVKAHEAQAHAHAARYQALAEIARSGDTTAKVAAVISLQAGGQGQQQSFIAPPKSFGEQALQWASLIVPTAAQVYAVKAQTAVALANSNNTAAIARSTNDAFVGIAGKIQAPAANITTNTTTTTNANQTSTSANQTSTTTNTSTTSTNTATTTIGRDGVIGDGALTRTCAAGSGGPGAGGAAGGSAAATPALAASGVPGSATATGGSGALGGSGGMGGALNC